VNLVSISSHIIIIIKFKRWLLPILVYLKLVFTRFIAIPPSMRVYLSPLPTLTAVTMTIRDNARLNTTHPTQSAASLATASASATTAAVA